MMLVRKTSQFLSWTPTQHHRLLGPSFCTKQEQQLCSHITQCSLARSSSNQCTKHHELTKSDCSANLRYASNNSFNNIDPIDTQKSSSFPNKQRIPFYGLPQKQVHKRATMLSFLPSFETIRSVMQLSSTQSETITKFIQQSMIAMRDPTRADAVAAVGEMTGRHQLLQLLRTMQQHPVGQQILMDRPIVSKTAIPYDHIIEQARIFKETYGTITNAPKEELTFGIAYGLFLLKHGFDPDERDDVKYLSSDGGEEEDIAYVMLRYRQCHDYWHVLTQLPPTVQGEIGLKLLELFHMNMPVAALSCLAQSAVILSKTTPVLTSPYIKDPTNRNTKINASGDLHTIWNLYLPWARQQARTMGAANVSLLNIRYEHEFSVPLHVLRQRLRLQPFQSS